MTDRPPPLAHSLTNSDSGASVPTVDRQRQPRVVSENNKINMIRRRIKERKIKQLIPLEELFINEPKFPSFYVITFPGVDIDSELNVIAADIEIKAKIGKPKKITKMNRNALLIEIANKEQGNKLLDIKKIDNNIVTTQIHRTMNEIKGTVYSEVMLHSTEEQILETLKEQGVTKVERMKRWREGTLVNTPRHILTFNRTKLPPLIKLAEWHRELVELYVPTPLRCSKCQKLGHTKRWCRREADT